MRSASRDQVRTNQLPLREAFGFLARAAVDQHLQTEGRDWEVEEVFQDDPELLGIGLDDSAWIEVTGERFVVRGAGRALVSDRGGTEPRVVLTSGEGYELAARVRG